MGPRSGCEAPPIIRQEVFALDWHQPWLLMLSSDELETLHDQCRYRAKSHRAGNEWGLAVAWDGLAHEVFDRMMCLYRQQIEEAMPEQLRFLA